MESLTLYSIEMQLLELVAYREDLLSGEFDMDESERRELLKVAEDRIKEYVTKEVAKVDGIAAMLREFEKREAIEKEESQRIAARAKRWAERKANLESMCMSIMQSMGKEKLDGKHSTLALRKCPPSAEIVQPHLIPSENMRVSMTVTLAEYDGIISELPSTLASVLIKSRTNPEPMKEAIRKALKAGEGVPGARLVTDKVRLEVR
jgi:hypothetical protein